MLFLKSSVKVVRHKERVFLLWRGVEKRRVGGAAENVPAVPGFSVRCLGF
jgi:hypothetical protein